MAPRPDGAGEPVGGPPAGSAEQTPPPPPHLNNVDFSRLYTVQTPQKMTEDSRLHMLRQRIMAIIGYATCLITGMMFAESIFDAFHVIPRSLHNSNWIIFCCFQEAIGIMINGERVLNLDHFGNVDFAQRGIHGIFDGGSFAGGRLGEGEFSFVPPDLHRHVEYLSAKENRGKDYRQLYPELKHKYIVYGFSDHPKHSFGRYPNPARTYDHLEENSTVLLQNELDTLKANAGLKPDDKSLRQGVLMGSRAPSDTNANPFLHVLHAGFNYIVISHINPVFAIFDYLLKMKYRCIDNYDEKPGLRADIPPADVQYFVDVMYPALKHWVEPSSEDQRSNFEAKKRQHKMKLRKHKNAAATEQPSGTTRVVPAVPRAKTHSGLVPSSSLTEIPSSPVRAVERTVEPAEPIWGTKQTPMLASSNPMGPSTPRDIVDEDVSDSESSEDSDASDFGVKLQNGDLEDGTELEDELDYATDSLSLRQEQASSATSNELAATATPTNDGPAQAEAAFVPLDLGITAQRRSSARRSASAPRPGQHGSRTRAHTTANNEPLDQSPIAPSGDTAAQAVLPLSGPRVRFGTSIAIPGVEAALEPDTTAPSASSLPGLDNHDPDDGSSELTELSDTESIPLDTRTRTFTGGGDIQTGHRTSIAVPTASSSASVSQPARQLRSRAAKGQAPKRGREDVSDDDKKPPAAHKPKKARTTQKSKKDKSKTGPSNTSEAPDPPTESSRKGKGRALG